MTTKLPASRINSRGRWLGPAHRKALWRYSMARPETTPWSVRKGGRHSWRCRNDLIDGGAGDDPALFSDEGDDIIWGGPGRDMITRPTTPGSSLPITASILREVTVNLHGQALRLMVGEIRTSCRGSMPLQVQFQRYPRRPAPRVRCCCPAWAATTNSPAAGATTCCWAVMATAIDGGDGISGFGNYIHGSVYRLYQAAFAHRPDVGGLQGWAGSIKAAQPSRRSRRLLRSRRNFRPLQAWTTRSSSRACTRTFWGAHQMLVAFASWLRSLNAGASRSEVLLGFSESDEFKNNSSLDVDAFMTSRFEC